MPDAGTASQHFSCAAVAQTVDGVNVTEMRRVAVSLEALAQCICADQKQAAVGVFLALEQGRPDLLHVFLEELSGHFSDWYLPIFAPFTEGAQEPANRHFNRRRSAQAAAATGLENGQRL